EIGTNGWLALGSGNSIHWTPSALLALNNPSAQFSCWSDLQPNLGGASVYEEAGSHAIRTFDQVLSWGTNDANTFQFEVDTATGNVSLYFGVMASATAHPMLIGYSPAGPNRDPGSTDIAQQLASNGLITVAPLDQDPLTLVPVSRPVQGAAAASWDVMVSS